MRLSQSGRLISYYPEITTFQGYKGDPSAGILKNKKLDSVEILFCLYSFILCGSLENDPLSPPEGEAVQGGHPLDPLFFSGYISTLSGVIAIGGMPERRGRKHEKVEPPRAIVYFYEDFNRAKN
jgi:hypothetical protein